MTETPRLTRYHTAIRRINDDLTKKKVLADPGAEMEIIEDHDREILATLRDIVASGALSNPPQHILQRLSDLGVIEHDERYVLQSSLLSEACSVLAQPTNPPMFYRQFYPFLVQLSQWASAATELIASVLLWRGNLLSDERLLVAADTYLEQGTPHLLKEDLRA